jgi:hypothetical protein
LKAIRSKFFIAFFLIAVLVAAGAVQTFANSSPVPGTVSEESAAGPKISQSMMPAAASATALQPVVTETGLISLSVDGLGTDSSGNIPGE